ncbi:hypothetical protein B296_00022018 [Ensete ventricosum]|uniref:Uncharacterized protein n=1 Tax=Ensete ventricosum TaxID=4639 RepID=A0A427AK67_ENSVE|nr:hypothetical protein B296_00022018 [Ensete ventricosum]
MKPRSQTTRCPTRSGSRESMGPLKSRAQAEVVWLRMALRPMAAIWGWTIRYRGIWRSLSRSQLGHSVTDDNINKVFDEMLMFVRVLRFVYIPCIASSGLALTEVRGIANSKDSVLMQGLVHGRQSVRGHPMARSELGTMEHQNFLFDMKGYICVTQEWVDEGELPRERTKNQRWQRPYDVGGLTLCLSIDQGELLGGHNSVEADSRKGRGSDNDSSGAQLPKSKASVRKEVDSEERHNAAEADLPIAKEGMKMQGNG